MHCGQIQSMDRFNINHEEFTLHNDIILRRHRVVIPELCSSILKELYTVHFGANKMKAIARNYCWLPGMDIDILS